MKAAQINKECKNELIGAIGLHYDKHNSKYKPSKAKSLFYNSI